MSRYKFLKSQGMAGIYLFDFLAGGRLKYANSRKWLVKIDTVIVIFMMKGFKHPPAVPPGRPQK
jgi:hypothetical protein